MAAANKVLFFVPTPTRDEEEEEEDRYFVVGARRCDREYYNPLLLLLTPCADRDYRRCQDATLLIFPLIQSSLYSAP